MRRLAFLLVASLASPVVGQTSFPMITHANPVALQRGQTTEIEVIGQQNFFGAYEAIFDGKGIKAQIVPQKEPPATPPAKPVVKSVKLKVTVDKDAAPGVRDFRIATSLGVSSIGQLVIVSEPVVKEKNPNNVVAQAQPIALPCVVAGALEAKEDVDFYKFEAKAGETLTFELFCARLQDRIHDLQNHAKPMLTLYDDAGREVAANDTFFFADPMLSYTIPKAGVYYIQVRESTYDGDPRWVYALLATNRPYASHVYPFAGNPGKKIQVEPIGSAAKVSKKIDLVVPDRLGLTQARLPVGKEETNPVTFLVNNLPPVFEQEPNDTPEQATRVTLPAGINGRIDKRRDMDHFVFAAKKGQAVQFELKARRFGTLLNSSLHGVLEVMDRKGAILALSDVSHGQEAKINFNPAADGDYVLRVRDLNSKGGESFVYHIEADFARPDFTLRCDPDKAMIGPGSSTAWYVHVVRENGFAGPVAVEVKGLPKDVVASPLTIPATMTQGLIVITAQPSAVAKTVTNVEVIGTGAVKDGAGKETVLTHRAVSNQEVYSPGGGRARFDVDLQTVGVTEPSDILRVGVSTTEIVLKPGEEVKIDVEILRRADYDKSISLDVILQHLGSKIGDPLPPGVQIVAGKSKTLLGTASKGFITLKADAGAAPIERVPVSVLCHVSINFVVKVSYSSPVIWVSVRK
ncbi:MAG: PPC domain-containing protein [Gemmataceae bacterium]